jgi:hypothetical protein
MRRSPVPTAPVACPRGVQWANHHQFRCTARLQPLLLPMRKLARKPMGAVQPFDRRGSALAEAQCLPRRCPCDIGRLTTAAWCSGSGGKDSSFTIYVGTLDDSSSFHPRAAIFARSRPAWAVIPLGLAIMHSTSLSGPVVKFFLDSVVRTSRRVRIRLGGEARDSLICGHEPALVARTCNPAKLLGFLKFVGTPRGNDARRCDPCGWHCQGAPAAMASGGEASFLSGIHMIGVGPDRLAGAGGFDPPHGGIKIHRFSSESSHR